jgi:hypothetical protein
MLGSFGCSDNEWYQEEDYSNDGLPILQNPSPKRIPVKLVSNSGSVLASIQNRGTTTKCSPEEQNSSVPRDTSLTLIQREESVELLRLRTLHGPLALLEIVGSLHHFAERCYVLSVGHNSHLRS